MGLEEQGKEQRELEMVIGYSRNHAEIDEEKKENAGAETKPGRHLEEQRPVTCQCGIETMVSKTWQSLSRKLRACMSSVPEVLRGVI